MKILVLTFNAAQLSSGEKQLRDYQCDHEFLFHHLQCNPEEFLSELKKSAKFAEENGCELLAAVPPGTVLDALEPLLSALPDSASPTALISGYNDSEAQMTQSENRAILMLQLLTGERVCGFRNDLKIYPVKLLNYVPEELYADPLFHVKILIRAAKAGYKIISTATKTDIPICLERRIPSWSLFIPALLKTLLPIPHKRLCLRNFQKEKAKAFFLHPLKFIKYLIKENATPGGLAMAAAAGMFLGTLPLLGIHTAAIIYVSVKLRLNKMLSVNISHLCMPPFVPFACIELGHYMLNGKWLSTASMQTVVKELDVRIFEWILGSLILAPVNALVFAAITYVIATILKKR